jgi:hypothetical protein
LAKAFLQSTFMSTHQDQTRTASSKHAGHATADPRACSCHQCCLALEGTGAQGGSSRPELGSQLDPYSGKTCNRKQLQGSIQAP